MKKKSKVEAAIKAERQAKAQRSARDPKASFLTSLADAAAPDLSALPAPGRAGGRAAVKEEAAEKGGEASEAAAEGGGDEEGTGGGSTAAYHNPYKRKPLPRAAVDGDKKQSGSDKPHGVKVLFLLLFLC